ncbi:MAG: alpha/beta hydrolase [Acidimicrobiia bacterium]
MDELTFADADGVQIFVRRWMPDGECRGHHRARASEHSGRYARVAEVLFKEDYAVYALDLRGHGRTAESTGRGRLGPSGVKGVLDDIAEVIRMAAGDVGDRPLVLFGHSMGSLFAQAFVEQREHDLAAYALSGAMGPMDGMDELAAGMREAADAGMADEHLNMLGDFNAAFEPARTKDDWLSRDPDEVDKYVADPLCGEDLPLTYGYIAGMMETLAATMEPEGIARTPKHLRVLLLTGEEDPVSNGGAQVRELEKSLREVGLAVTAKYYPGARHEVLNETNRDEVHRDLISWLDRVTEG